jgi:hypothetical protein
VRPLRERGAPVSLFDPEGFTVEPVPPMSAGMARTRRNNDLIARGVHPITRLELRAEGGTCATCAYAVKEDHGARHYWKCWAVPVTHGAATDLRISWPACTRYVDRAVTRECPACSGRRGHAEVTFHPHPPRKDGSPSSRPPERRSRWIPCEACLRLGWIVTC